MGEISESMLDGSHCESCGDYLGEPVGYPMTCAECGGDDSLLDSDQHRRARNRQQSNTRLREAGYDFDERNGAAHLIVRTARGVIDFWPGTGKWIPRFKVKGKPYHGHGVRELIAFAGPAKPALASPFEIQWWPHMTPFSVGIYQRAGFTVTGVPDSNEGQQS